MLFFREHIICDIWFNYTKNILHTRHEKVAKVFLFHFLISSYVAVGAADTLQNVKKIKGKKGHKEDEVQKIKRRKE